MLPRGRLKYCHVWSKAYKLLEALRQRFANQKGEAGQ